MKRISKMLVLTMLVALTACSSTTPTSTQTASTSDATISFTPGTYTGTGTGHGGDITVKVTLTEDKISDITVTESNETSGFGDVAAEHIITAILDNQSFDVDAVSGCTLSANGIRQAIESALESAGADVDALKKVVKQPVETKDVTLDTDVVVIGSGAVGLTAAYEAENAGADVIILEKLARTGGATRMSSGMLVAGGTELQAEANIEDSTQNLIDYLDGTW